MSDIKPLTYKLQLKAIALLLCLALPYGGWAITLYPIEDSKKAAQFQHLLRELRCLVCQNQDLADSNAPLAKDIRNQVYQMVLANKSDSEITTYLINRYGDFILFKPPVRWVTALLWFGPILFLLIGFGLFWQIGLKRVTYE